MSDFLKYALIGLIAISLASCSGGEEMETAHVEGSITVADSVDNSKDYADIEVVIYKKDSTSVPADTLYSAVTAKDGRFSGTAEFDSQRQYILSVSRNNQNLGRTGIILADGDSVNISAELPGLLQTLSIRSREHEALNSYNRVERSFQRVGVFARAGRLKGDSLKTELSKWPDIYWDVYEKFPQTVAGRLSAKKSVELLNEWDKPKMMDKISQIEEEDDLVYLAATYGTQYKAQSEQLEPALKYLNNLDTKTSDKQARMRIQMERIDLLYDSARVKEAQQALEAFKKDFDGAMASKWAQSVAYDLNYLSPGDAIPSFNFTDNSHTVSRENLKGRPYLLEITSLANPIYQEQYDRTVVIHSLYKNYEFEVVTIPLDTSRVTVQAFFEERVRPWAVAPANTFNTRELIERFNIKNLPTRFLVNRDGRIVQRYVGDEYDDVIQGIQQIMNEN